MPGVGSDTRRERRSRTRGWTAIIGSSLLVWSVSAADICWAQRPFPGAAAPSASAESSSGPVTSEWSQPSTPPAVKQAQIQQVSAEEAVPETRRPAPAVRPAPLESIQPRSGSSVAAPETPLKSIDPSKNTGIKQVNFSVEKLLETPLSDVVVEGNDTIRTDAILRHVSCRPGRLANPRMVQQDVTQLLNTRWFYSVNPTYRETDEGPILVFKVVEKPILESVKFRGNKKIKVGELEAHTGLRPGHAYDVAANRESVYRIRQLYHDKGYRFAEVTLVKGDSPSDREVIMDIVEGPKPKIWSIKVNGNSDISASILKTKISSKTVKLWIIQGDYDPEVIRNDELALKQYYMGLGYFDVDVTSDVSFSEDKSKVTVNFAVQEGPRYRVKGIEVVGNEVIGREKLLSSLKLKNGDYFNERFLKEDVNFMTDQYDSQGRLFAKVIPTPRFREGEEPVVDLVYSIDEDVPRYIGMINIHIRGDYPHSQEEVVRQQVNRFLKSGHLARSSDLRMAQARVNGSGLWDREDPPSFDIKPTAGTEYWPQTTVRGQSHVEESTTPTESFWETGDLWTDDGMERFFFGGSELDLFPPADAMTPVSPVPGEVPSATPPPTTVSALPPPNRRRSVAKPPVDSTLPGSVFLAGAGTETRSTTVSAEAPPSESSPFVEPGIIFRGQSSPMMAPPQQYAPAPEGTVFFGPQGNVVRPQSIDQYGLPVPQNYFEGDSPQGDPFGDAFSAPPPGFVDVNIDVTEGRTGRLMFGVGVNSDAGVVGSIVLQEDNFDLFRPPTSWTDVLNGQAWRGAGQSFRLEAVPGSEVSRYMVSWTNPYFMRSDFSLGVNGFYYNRFFESWTEDRLGGRISIGYVLDRYWSVSTALRLENVEMRNIPLGAPPVLASTKGDNFLSTGSVTLTYDARDNAFMPTRGNFVSATYEQGFGEFNYPRADLAASQFFTVYERPDGFGKHILSLSGQLGFTGNDTPIFEKYYAGGYSSFRGFYFRGVSPVQNGYKVGGDFMALGSAEYMIPITANDNLRAVVFTDFGTVEPDVSLEHFRLSVGAGLRVIIPAMGPAPLAFDFGFPIMKEATDRERMFSFYVGFTR